MNSFCEVLSHMYIIIHIHPTKIATRYGPCETLSLGDTGFITGKGGKTEIIHLSETP